MIKSNIGAIMDGLNLKIIKSIEIPLPPIQLQQKFASLVQQVEQIRQHQEQSKQQIDHFFNVLMQKAFNGELEA
jgi:type I restriction enzyme S subunit